MVERYSEYNIDKIYPPRYLRVLYLRKVIERSEDPFNVVLAREAVLNLLNKDPTNSRLLTILKIANSKIKRMM